MRFASPVVADGTVYVARACARQRTEDGLWEGWIEFDAGDDVLATPRETTQPNRDAAHYWAEGLTPVFLEGALARAIDATPRAT